jgi:alpha-L-fucosidase
MNKLKTKTIAIASIGGWLAVYALSTPYAHAESNVVTPENRSDKIAQQDHRMAWWRESRFGLFIHWGIYSVPAGQWGSKTNYGEWFQAETKMAEADYSKYASQFDPTNFNARQWVKIAKDAGMKYIVITAKHHDGFCMYDTAYTDYNIVKGTPYARDPMKDLAEACKDAGVKLGFFYSLPDWHHPDMPAALNQRGFHGAARTNAVFSNYLLYARNQVKELLTQYGPVGVIWFDGGGAFRGSGRSDQLEADKMIEMIHQIQPDCLINNRIGAGGDFGTPEQKIPGQRLTSDFEVCMTLNRHWGYNSKDQNWKSAKTVIANLSETAAKGGNYLLNVGPTAEGAFPEAAIQILSEVGQWLKVNGEAIYGTTGTPFRSVPWGNCTAKLAPGGGTVYLHVLQWPAEGRVLVPGLKNDVLEAYVLSDSKKSALQTQHGEGGLVVTLPEGASDPIATVVVLKLRGTLELLPPETVQMADGSFKLFPDDAHIHGVILRSENSSAGRILGNWDLASEWVEWPLKVSKPGKFDIVMEIASAGGSLEIAAGGAALTATIPMTTAQDSLQITNLGAIEISGTNSVFFSLRPIKEGWRSLELRAIQLKPVK